MIQKRFDLFGNIRYGTMLFRQLIPFGTLLLIVSIFTSLMMDHFLDGLYRQYVLDMTYGLYSVALLIKIKDIYYNIERGRDELTREISEVLMPAFAGALTLVMMSLCIKFYLALMLPWFVLLYAVDIIFAILFMFVYHCIALGRDITFDAILTSFDAFTHNKGRVLFLGLFIIFWRVLLLLPDITSNSQLYATLRYFVTPVLGGYLLCINTCNYLQMVNATDINDYRYLQH